MNGNFLNNNTNIKSILVFIGPYSDDAIGENFIKLPFLRALAKTYPDARICWMHGTKLNMFAGILEPIARGLIDEFLPSSVLGDGWANALSPRRLLPDRHFDLIIDTQTSPMYTLMLRRISHGILISPSWRYFFSARKPAKNEPKSQMLAEKLLSLLSLATGSKDNADHVAELPDEYWRAATTILPKTNGNGPVYVGLAPGAGRMDTGKCWPLENYIEIARQQLAADRVPVFFLGPLEQEWCKQIEEEIPGVLFAPLEWTQGEGKVLNGPALTVAIASRLSVSVANCSGTGHMLAAGGSKMVSLFGPTNPRKFAPYTPDLIAIRAQDFGQSAIAAIPVQVVLDAIETSL